MDVGTHHKCLQRKDDRIVIHFDYDCFYASVFEAENPALKSLPLAVQQKHIVVTCNYEARRRGLYKLQLITEAKRICPEVLIVLGEDISRFRDASKELFNFLAPLSWSRKVERLGFDEVWFDVTDTVEYNMGLLNPNALDMSFFQLSKDDPTHGFDFDATQYAGNTYPSDAGAVNIAERVNPDMALRLKLGSHLAMHMRHELEHHKRYTATVGISTNKTLSKLVGNLNKPQGQTTLLPPYNDTPDLPSNATAFMDGHEIGKVPGIGFKTSQKIRELVLGRPADFSTGLIYGGTREQVTVRDVRLHPDVDAEGLERLLAGPGAAHGIGARIWALLHGVDDAEVAAARAVPRQISIEDSYVRLDSMAEVVRELTALAKSLVTRMRIDLVVDDDDGGEKEDQEKEEEEAGLARGETHDIDTGHGEAGGTTTTGRKKWLAHPRTLRLSTRPRQPLRADGTRVRSFKRISHSAALPGFVFALDGPVGPVAEKLVGEALVPMFRRLHPQPRGWNLSLVNVAVTNMVETAGGRTSEGRDIGGMFKGQEGRLRAFKVVEEGGGEGDDGGGGDVDVNDVGALRGQETHFEVEGGGMERASSPTDDEAEDAVRQDADGEVCETCGAMLPPFALAAHERYHELGD